MRILAGGKLSILAVSKTDIHKTSAFRLHTSLNNGRSQLHQQQHNYIIYNIVCALDGIAHHLLYIRIYTQYGVTRHVLIAITELPWTTYRVIAIWLKFKVFVSFVMCETALKERTNIVALICRVILKDNNASRPTLSVLLCAGVHFFFPCSF